jgi:hypothetical protein
VLAAIAIPAPIAYIKVDENKMNLVGSQWDVNSFRFIMTVSLVHVFQFTMWYPAQINDIYPCSCYKFVHPFKKSPFKDDALLTCEIHFNPETDKPMDNSQLSDLKPSLIYFTIEDVK